MQILLDSGAHDQRNKGNVALLQVAVSRLSQFWPTATIHVISDAPHLVRLYCSKVYPVNPFGKDKWFEDHPQYDRFHRLVPNFALRFLFELRDALQRRKVRSSPNTLNEHNGVEREVIPVDPVDKKAVDYSENGQQPLSEIIAGMDLVVASGGGYMCDSDKVTAVAVLERLDLAIKHHIRTVMVGQGFGPIQDQEFREKAGQILPKVDLILVREISIAPPLLESLGVDSNRILITGDDAIELAYDARPKVVGDGIGVNLRMAHYTEVDSGHIQAIKPVLHASALKFDARLIALPIAHSHKVETLDAWAIEQLLEGFGRVIKSRLGYGAPSEIIKRVGKCRLVVTGAFHPAVFALSQGIPVVGIAKSDEYVSKLSTLNDMFGMGCEVIHLDDSLFSQKLK